MRLLRILLGLAVVLALAAVGAFAFLLPRIAERPEVRARIVEEARAATGRELSYEGIGVALLPPRLEMRAPVLAGAEGEAPLSAERIGLRIAWLPLLARTLVVERVDVVGPALTVLRTEDGFALPFSPPEEEPEEPRPEDALPEEGSRDDGFTVQLRGIRIDGAAITLEDRTLDPPATLRFEQVDATVQGAALTESADFDVAARLADTGRLTARGRRAAGGDLDLSLQLADLSLATLEPWIGDDDFAGRLELDLTAAMQREVFETLEAKLKLHDAELEFGDVVVSGQVPLTAELAGPVDRLAGPVVLDLDAAQLAVEDVFVKPAGVQGRLAGRLIQEGDARTLEGLEVQLHNLRATGEVSLGSRTEIRLTAPAFGIAGWETMIPALGDEPLPGTVQLEDLALGMGPLSVRGSFLVAGFEYPLEEGQLLTLNGRLRGTGDAIVGEDLDLRVAEQPFQLDLQIQELAGTPRMAVRLDADEADSQVLLTALSGKEDALSGPLRLRSEWAGPLTGEGDLLQRVTGKLRFDVAPGRLRGVSLLEQTVDGLRKEGGAVVAAARLAAGEKAEKYYADRFERLGGTLAVKDGVAGTRDLRLQYRDYRVDLRGSVGLVGRELDLRGTLTLFEELDQELAGEGEAPREPRRRVIPLAAVKGTVDDPNVTITQEAALAFGAAYVADDRRREKWERKIDERLGEGSGKDVLDILDSILTGEPPPAEPEGQGAP